MREELLAAIRGISQDQIYKACGTIGGLALAGAQLPQIYHVTKRARSRDISYTYQLIFVSGMCCFLVYYGYYRLWAVFFPSCLSLASMSYLIGLKVYLEVLKPKRTVSRGVINRVMRDDNDDDYADDDDGLDRPLLDGEDEHEGEEDEFLAYTAPVS